MSLVNIEKVEKYFGPNHVLKGVDLQVEAGEVISIIGRSGSGKSTLLRCINALESYEAGRIVVDGMEVDPKKTDLRQLRQKVGMVFQSFNLFPHLSAARNIMLAPMIVKSTPKQEAAELARRMLEKVGLAEKFASYPDQLSGGQQQRVAIARALAMSPAVLLCDEITSALDPELVGEVLKVLEQLAADGMTLILVTHEMRFAREVGDRIVFMHLGKIWEQGPAKELFYEPKTPELQQFLGAVRQEETHHAKKRIEPASQAAPGIQLTHESAAVNRLRARSTAQAPTAERIMVRCEELARHSELPGQLTRVFLSREQAAANELVLGWMREAGMSAKLDAIGNVVGRYEGERPGLPCLMLGSHLDTVRDAGKYDGMLGVVSAIECVADLAARGKRLSFAIEVIGFADEEGVRFDSTLLGSRAVAGAFKRGVLDSVDANGVNMRDAMRDFGLDPERIDQAAYCREDVLAYAELHIEQGPVLEAEGLPVGVVVAINGATRLAVEIDGAAGHAGTVPMTLRTDALAAAAECVLAIERRCASVPELVGTVGKLETLPGAVNVIPGKVKFTVDVRSPRDPDREAAVNDLLEEIGAVAKRRGVSVKVAKTHEGGVAACAPWLMEQIGAAIAAEGLVVRKLPSGAGHDGMAMIDLCDIGMIFVRCEKGISHNPAEAISAADVETGLRVFLRFIENFRPESRR